MKKGVSPIIAAVLLIAVTVGIAAIVINWASTFSKQETTKITSNTNTQCAGLALRFDEAPSVSGDTLTLKLTNIGTDKFDAVKEFIMWDNDSTTTAEKTFSISKGGYAVITVKDTDVTEGPNFTTMTTAGRQIKEIRIFPQNCESNYSPWQNPNV